MRTPKSNPWTLNIRSTAASSNSITTLSTMAFRNKLIVEGISWHGEGNNSTSAMSTSYLSVTINGTSAFELSGNGTICGLGWEAETLKLKWESSSPGGTIMSACAWGWMA